MEKYKINSSRLKHLVGYQLVLVNNYYSKDNDTNVPDRSNSEFVLIDEVKFDESIGYTIVKCHNKCTGKHCIYSLRRNGISLNKNEKGTYEHYFNYENLNYIIVKVVSMHPELGRCEQEFSVPLSLKSSLIAGIADVNKSVLEIFTSNEVYASPEEAINSLPTYNKIY